MLCNFGLKSYLCFQIELALRACSILKSRVSFQPKLHSTQFNYHCLNLAVSTVTFTMMLLQINLASLIASPIPSIMEEGLNNPEKTQFNGLQIWV